MEENRRYLRAIGHEKFEHFVGMIAGKWKLRIIFALALNGVLRYSELKRLIKPITHKMLSSQLKELERDGLIARKVYQQVPPKVEYSMTKKGKDLNLLAKEIHDWIIKYDIVVEDDNKAD